MAYSFAKKAKSEPTSPTSRAAANLHLNDSLENRSIAYNSSTHKHTQGSIQLIALDSHQAEKPIQFQTKSYQNSNSNQSTKTTNNGLPHQLQKGIESLSGYSMGDVKVHYNSPKPAQLQAHAYAQGTDIHLSSGQEKHLPHEAWHVVQQKQGRVKPSYQLKTKAPINDDSHLEKEADEMGAKALQANKQKPLQLKRTPPHLSPVVQRTKTWRETIGGYLGVAIGGASGLYNNPSYAGLREGVARGYTEGVEDPRGKLEELAGAIGAVAGATIGFATGIVKEKTLVGGYKGGKQGASHGYENPGGTVGALLGGAVGFVGGSYLFPPLSEDELIEHEDGALDTLTSYLPTVVGATAGYLIGQRLAPSKKTNWNEEAPHEVQGSYVELEQDDIPDWLQKYTNNKLGVNWLSTTEKITDVLAQEEENIEASEEHEGHTMELESRKRYLAHQKDIAEAREHQLMDLTFQIVPQPEYERPPRSETKRLSIEIKTLNREAGNQLNDLYEALNIPTDDPGGSRSPRKFGDATGTLIYFGSLPKGLDVPDTVTRVPLTKEEFEEEIQRDTHYYQIAHGASSLVYYPQRIEPPTGVLRTGGYSHSFSQGNGNQAFYRQQAMDLDSKKTEPRSTQGAIYTSNARRKDRGAGQFAAMNDTNAAAYAFGIGLTNALQTNWEWLHIRGAGLGGVTDSTNLIVGTYSANSHMIPFENQIKTMSAYANGRKPLIVEWHLQRGTRKFEGRKITIKIYAPDGLHDKSKNQAIPAIPESEAWVVSFDPKKAIVFDKFLRGAAWLRFKEHKTS